ncbi:MAG: AbrB/MazE/SpoVT family DNA-binding domain-containing protein [Burkholderiales bacterium]|nr:AbrB/MazE/SpoVT family DNA-binding domain-containing protein [Burkholderiales bacterium]
MPKSIELSATVSSKGQVVIPGDVRRRLGLVQGSVLRFVVDAQGVRLLPAAGDVRRLKGRLPAPPKPVSVADMNRAIAERRSGIANRG